MKPDASIRLNIKCYLHSGVCPVEFGAPPIGQRASAQPLAAFPSHKYRPALLSRSTFIFIPSIRRVDSLARSTCRLFLAVLAPSLWPPTISRQRRRLELSLYRQKLRLLARTSAPLLFRNPLALDDAYSPF